MRLWALLSNLFTDVINRMTRQLDTPASLATSFQGSAHAFQSSLTGMPVLIAAALVVIYIILGVLYENAIHPITGEGENENRSVGGVNVSNGRRIRHVRPDLLHILPQWRRLGAGPSVSSLGAKPLPLPAPGGGLHAIPFDLCAPC